MLVSLSQLWVNTIEKACLYSLYCHYVRWQGFPPQEAVTGLFVSALVKLQSAFRAPGRARFFFFSPELALRPLHHFNMSLYVVSKLTFLMQLAS